MSFSNYAGNQAVIAAAKATFGASKLTIVVGRVRGGRTTFVRALEDHFSAAFRFEYYSVDDGVDALRTAITNADVRKPGVMQAWISGAPSLAGGVAGVKIVIDDFDPTERGVCAMLEGLTMRRNNGIVLVTDGMGMRKLSGLKKRGALVLLLTNPGREAVQRWARRALLPDCPDEDDLDRLRAMMRACDATISRLKDAYETGATPEQAAMDRPDKVSDDNQTMMQQIFCKGVPLPELHRMVDGDGGSMLGQLVVHNAPATGMGDEAYAAALATSLRGMVLERAGQVTHDKELTSAGHVLTIAPFMRASHAPLDRCSFTYTSSMAQSGARAAARRALSIACHGESVAEKAHRGIARE